VVKNLKHKRAKIDDESISQKQPKASESEFEVPKQVRPDNILEFFASVAATEKKIETTDESSDMSSQEEEIEGSPSFQKGRRKSKNSPGERASNKDSTMSHFDLINLALKRIKKNADAVPKGLNTWEEQKLRKITRNLKAAQHYMKIEELNGESMPSDPFVNTPPALHIETKNNVALSFKALKPYTVKQAKKQKGVDERRYRLCLNESTRGLLSVYLFEKSIREPGHLTLKHWLVNILKDYRIKDPKDTSQSHRIQDVLVEYDRKGSPKWVFENKSDFKLEYHSVYTLVSGTVKILETLYNSKKFKFVFTPSCSKKQKKASGKEIKVEKNSLSNLKARHKSNSKSSPYIADMISSALLEHQLHGEKVRKFERNMQAVQHHLKIESIQDSENVGSQLTDMKHEPSLGIQIEEGRAIGLKAVKPNAGGNTNKKRSLNKRRYRLLLTEEVHGALAVNIFWKSLQAYYETETVKQLFLSLIKQYYIEDPESTDRKYRLQDVLVEYDRNGVRRHINNQTWGRTEDEFEIEFHSAYTLVSNTVKELKNLYKTNRFCFTLLSNPGCEKEEFATSSKSLEQKNGGVGTAESRSVDTTKVNGKKRSTKINEVGSKGRQNKLRRKSMNGGVKQLKMVMV